MSAYTDQVEVDADETVNRNDEDIIQEEEKLKDRAYEELVKSQLNINRNKSTKDKLKTSAD